LRRKLIFCDPEKCVGCQLCEFACSISKERRVNPYLSRIRLVRIEPFIMMAIACQLCDDPPCVRSCPTKALFASPETGIIRVDERKCNGCGWCIQACKFGAIALRPTSYGKKVVVCDLCDGDPKCVKHCPTEALSYATLQEASQRTRRKSVEKILRELIKS